MKYKVFHNIWDGIYPFHLQIEHTPSWRSDTIALFKDKELAFKIKNYLENDHAKCDIRK